MKEEILARKKTCDTATGNKSISQKKKMFKHYEQDKIIYLYDIAMKTIHVECVHILCILQWNLIYFVIHFHV